MTVFMAHIWWHQQPIEGVEMTLRSFSTNMVACHRAGPTESEA